MLKMHLRNIVICAPLLIAARYLLFKDAAEFQRFFYVVKNYVAPGLIVLALVMIATLLYSVARKLEPATQKRLNTTHYWAGVIFCVVSFGGAFAYTKLVA